jgi:hypothetical protein
MQPMWHLLDSVIHFAQQVSSHYLVQVTPVIVLGLIILELVSFMVSPHPFSKLFRSISRLFRFADGWDSISAFLWLLLAFLSMTFPRNLPPVSYSLVTAGIVMFLLGWLLRYQHTLLEYLSKKSRRIRPFLKGYWKLWARLRLSRAHSELLGPSLEIIGISVMCKSYAFFPAFFVFPMTQIAAILYHNRKSALTNPNVARLTLRDVFPNSGHIAVCFAVPSVAGVLAGLAVRELTFFDADIDTAKSILFTISQIEGSVGILAITIIFVLTQLTASNYSTRIPAILFRQPAFWTPLLILFGSIVYNLSVVAHAPNMFPSGDFHSAIIDFSFFLGIATACSITYFIFRAPRMVSPESIVADSLKSFDKKWLDQVKKDWSQANFHVRLNISYDPLIVIERIMSRAIDSGDSLTYVSALITIRDHIHSMKSLDHHALPNYILELDAYLLHHFRSLIRTAAKRSDEYSLLQLVNFVREIGDPSPDSIIKCNAMAFGFDDAPGELLLREVVRQSVECGLTECVRRSISLVKSRAAQVIKTLPDQTETWLYNGLPIDKSLSHENQEKLWANDRRIQSFARQYLEYLQDLGVRASESKSGDWYMSAGVALNELVCAIVKDVKGHGMKAIILRDATSCLLELGKATVDKKSQMTLSLLEYAMRDADPQNDEPIAWSLVNLASEVLVIRAQAASLGYGEVVESAMLGLEVVKQYTNPGLRLLNSMGEAARLLKDHPGYHGSKDLQYTYHELINRIRQVAQSGPRKDPILVTSAAKSILQSLGETESEQG